MNRIIQGKTDSHQDRPKSMQAQIESVDDVVKIEIQSKINYFHMPRKTTAQHFSGRMN